MKKIIVASAIATLGLSAAAQSAIDAYNLNPTELRGTARFMSMGGAFTSLGGDLSAVSQNPAGIGVYRRNEIGATLDIDFNKATTSAAPFKQSDSQTKAHCNNFGYVGVADLGNSSMRTFAWGVTYNRVASYENFFRGYNSNINTSLSNYIASFTNGVDESYLGSDSSFDPYTDSNADWLSILGYNAYMINPKSGNTYQGLFNNGTSGSASYSVRERGYLDSYDITFGGNVSDVVYWGAGLGIIDMSYTRQTEYSEGLDNASIYSASGSIVKGQADFSLANTKYVTGSGANLKFGVILRPVNEFRFGISVQTPTWMRYTHNGQGYSDYSYYNPNSQTNSDNPWDGTSDTDWYTYDSRINSPWHINLGVSAVLDQSLIVSFDYERVAYNDMKVKYQSYDGWYTSDFIEDTAVTDDIKTYFQAANIARLGLEYRVTPQFSVRAGYNYQSSNVKSETADGYNEVYTSGTDPSFRLEKDTHTVSVGAGYRYQQFYIDAAYVHRQRESTFHAFTNYDNVVAPSAKLTDTRNALVISAGFKF